MIDIMTALHNGAMFGVSILGAVSVVVFAALVVALIETVFEIIAQKFGRKKD